MPRLSTVTPLICDVSSAGRLKLSLCGSVVISVLCSMNPTGSTHEILLGKSALIGTPLTFAQTVSPKTKSVCGVVQSAANVSNGSTNKGEDGPVSMWAKLLE